MATALALSWSEARGYPRESMSGPPELNLIALKPWARIAAVGCHRHRPLENTKYLILSCPITAPQLFASVAQFRDQRQHWSCRKQSRVPRLPPHTDGVERVIACRGVCGREPAIEQGGQAVRECSR